MQRLDPSSIRRLFQRRFLICCAPFLIFAGCLHRAGPAPGAAIEFSGVASTGAVMVVEKTEGIVEARANEDDSWERVHAGSSVKAPAQVRTVGDSKVTLVVPASDSTLSLGVNSMVELISIEAPVTGDPSALHVKIQLIEGVASGNVRAAQSGASFEIIGAGGAAVVYSPFPGQTLSFSMSAQTAPILGTFDAPDLESFRMHPRFDVIVEQIPEPGTQGLLLAGTICLFVTQRWASRVPFTRRKGSG